MDPRPSSSEFPRPSGEPRRATGPAGDDPCKEMATTAAGDSSASRHSRRVVVLGLCDQFGRYLASQRFVVDLAQIGHLQTGRYLLPAEFVDGDKFTIELFARLDVLKPE
jgi:hypothetical protein